MFYCHFCVRTQKENQFRWMIGKNSNVQDRRIPPPRARKNIAYTKIHSRGHRGNVFFVYAIGFFAYEHKKPAHLRLRYSGVHYLPGGGGSGMGGRGSLDARGGGVLKARGTRWGVFRGALKSNNLHKGPKETPPSA